MARRTIWPVALTALLLYLAGPVAAQQPKYQEPPEEDETLATPENYTFNPLQAEKEMKVGNFYFKKGSWRAAAMRFEEATKWDPNMAEAFLRLGEAREKQKDFKAASIAYKKYVDLAPDAKDVKDVQKKIEELKPEATAKTAESKGIS